MTQPKQNSKVTDFDPLYAEIRGSIDSMLDMTGRIDERLKMLYERDEEYKEEVQELSRQVNSVLQRLATLDAVLSPACEDIMEVRARLRDVEIKVSGFGATVDSHSGKLDKYIDWAFKVALTAVGIYATYLIGK